MEDNLNFCLNGRQPHFFLNERQHRFIFQIEDDFNILMNEDNLNLIQMEDYLNILANGRQPQKKIMQPKTIKIETMVVAPLRVT
jgi:hypothetical protein